MTDRPDFDETWLRLFDGAEEGVEVSAQLIEAALDAQRAYRACDVASLKNAAARCVALTKFIAGSTAELERLKDEIQARG